MSDNLGGESFDRKQKLKKLSKTSLRLRGWMKYRIKRSAKPFVHIRLESFCDLTGKSLRTAKRCLNALRSEDNDLVIRTINQDGVWKIVASTCSRLHGEPAHGRNVLFSRCLRYRWRGAESGWHTFRCNSTNVSRSLRSASGLRSLHVCRDAA